MIDIHCHILPAVDDGSDSLQTSVFMAAMAADDGTEAIIATPHVTWNNGIDLSEKNDIDEAYSKFCSVLEGREIPVKCYLGAEVLIGKMVGYDFDPSSFPRLADTDYALVEFYFDDEFEKMDYCIYVLRQNGIKPVIAHPERYSAIQGHKDVLKHWVKNGVSLQLNKGSLMGHFGKRVQQTADWIMTNHLASFIASDAHNIRSRTPLLSNAAEELSLKYGKKEIRALLNTNPLRLLDNGSFFAV